MIRIVIADDHAVVRQGLKQILEESREMKVVAEHANGADALRCAGFAPTTATWRCSILPCPA